MKFGVVVFPGTTGDADCQHVLKNVLGQQVEYIWHNTTNLKDCDCVILPGGFSYGDYLRPGAMAKLSPVMAAVADFAQSGGLVLGMGNGFQILLEAGLLPGAVLINNSLRFNCQHVFVRVENEQMPFTQLCQPGNILKMPIAHGTGQYYCTPETLKELQQNNQVVFKYSNEQGETVPTANPNGSVENIAGICNRGGNVLGMMPHPERSAEAILGNEDGAMIFKSVLTAWQRRTK